MNFCLLCGMRAICSTCRCSVEAGAYDTTRYRLLDITRDDGAAVTTCTLDYSPADNITGDQRHDDTALTLTYDDRNRLSLETNRPVVATGVAERVRVNGHRVMDYVARASRC